MWWLLACAQPEVVLTFDPDPLDFGEVAIVPEMPDTGYAQLELTINNAGEEEVTLQLEPYDTTWFCVEGFPPSEDPAPLSTLSPGAFYILKVGICGHEPGSTDSESELGLGILTDGSPSRFQAKVLVTPFIDTTPQ